MRTGALLLAALAACAAPAGDAPLLEEVRLEPRIVRGIPSDEAQDAVVLVMHYDALAGGAAAASGCTGTLLAPNLVLTARHCVALTDTGAACNARGEPVAGGAVTRDHEPSAIFVFGGRTRPDFLGGTARPSRGVELLTTGARTLCNNDIALVLVDPPVAGAKIAPVRLDAPPVRGEAVTVVGWGVTEREPDPPARLQRTGLAVDAIGPASQLGPAEFRIGEATCDGDSGGPALAATGAVLGALSRGGAGGPAGPEGCLDTTNVYTGVFGHADLLRAGYERAKQTPWIEGEPNPLLAVNGAACAANADCQSGACDRARGTCAQDCAASACAAGQTCVGQDLVRLCRAEPDDAGCTQASRSGRFPTLPAVSVLVVLFAWVRRRKIESGRRPPPATAESGGAAIQG